MIAEVLVQTPVAIAVTLLAGASLIAIITRLIGRRAPTAVPIRVRSARGRD